MGINVDDTTLVELPGNEITEFKIYTTTRKSFIVWKSKKDYFIYSLDESDHILKANELFKQLQKNGITTFVAERDGKSLRFHKYRKVFAIQITGNKY